MRHCIDSYGNVVTNSYSRIKVSVSGSGKNVILILGRKTSPSSIIEMKPLVHLLEDKYTVVTMDYPGSGSSDNYHSMRTLEIITSEIHEVMELHGYTTYSIVALTYSGLYSLYYANKYTDEVKAVIGIDAFTAEQNNIESYRETVRFVYYLWRDFHKSKIVQWFVEKAAAHYIKTAELYSFSEQEIESYSYSALCMLDDMLLLEEYHCGDENFTELDGVTFPVNIPVMFILSSRRSRRIPKWYELHKKLLSNDNGKIVTLRGGKNLHLKQSTRIADEIKGFLP